MTDPDLSLDAVEERLAKLSPPERGIAEARLGRLLTRRRALRKYRVPSELAVAFGGPAIRVTPLLQMFDAIMVSAQQGYQTRWIVNTPPQETKTTSLNQWGALWLLLHDPSRPIGVASYEQNIAARSGLQVRQIIEAHGAGYAGAKKDPARQDDLGLLLDPRRGQSTAWSLSGIHGENGGMISVGVGSALTGRALRILFIDDPLKDAEQAQSLIYRERVWNWWQSVARTRLSGHTIVVVSQTRWHEDDLSGRLLNDDESRPHPQWSKLIVPAQAKEADPLGRAPGEWLESVHGRTEREWLAIRRDVGERWWSAMYDQEPSPPAGGIFQKEWIDQNRVGTHPELAIVCTYVDPADNTGTGDEAGIITMGLGVNQRIYVLEDASGHHTVNEWLRVALLAAVRWHGSVRYEQSLSGLKRSAEKAWRDIRYEAGTLRAFRRADLRAAGHDPERVPWPLTPDPDTLAAAVAHVAREDDDALTRRGIEARLTQLWPLTEEVMALPKPGPQIASIRARGTKTWRASNAAGPYQRGDVAHVGHFPRYEKQLVSWTEAQDSPDRMDAGVHGVTDLSSRSGGADVEATDAQLPTRHHRVAMTAIPRSTAALTR